MRSATFLSRVVLAIIVAPGFIGCTEGSTTYGPLHEAARTGNAEVARSWIREKRNLDEKYNDTSFSLESNYSRIRGLTALMVAAESGQLEIAKILIDGGANIYAESRWADGSSPRNAFDYAVDGGHLAVAAHLWANSDKVRFARSLDQHLASACSRFCDERHGSNDAGNLALFIAKITTDEETLANGIGLVGCWPHSLPRLKFLAEHGVRFPKNTLHCITARDASHYGLAERQARIEVAQFLLTRGADPNALPKDVSGFTPLMKAAAWNDLDMVKLLLAHGADSNRENSQGKTAIMAAANSCSHAQPGSALERDKMQLAVIEELARAGAHAAAGPKVPLLVECCARQPQTETQERICRVFGRNPN